MHMSAPTYQQVGPAKRPGPVYPSGWQLAAPVVRYVLANLRYSVRRRKYPLFKLRALLTLPRKGMISTWRLSRLGKYYFGASLRTPRWPSPAFDHMIANGGMNLDEKLTDSKRHIDTAILAITRRCSYQCQHCYDSFNRAADDVITVDRWIQTINELQQVGVSVIILSGGEPMSRYDDILTILDHFDPRLSDIHIHTSGAGVTPARAQELGRRGLVAAGIGLDFPDAARQNRFRGSPDAFRDAVGALEMFADAGVFTYTNLCLTKDLIDGDGLYRYLEFARNLRVGAVQLLEPKPCGKYSARSPEELLPGTYRTKVLEFFQAANSTRQFSNPPVGYTSYFEKPEYFGCLMGGLAHLSIDANGNVKPCVFVPVSFGNIREESFAAIYHRMRRLNSRPFRGGCPALLLSKALAEARNHQTGDAIPFAQFTAQWEATVSARGDCHALRRSRSPDPDPADHQRRGCPGSLPPQRQPPG